MKKIILIALLYVVLIPMSVFASGSVNVSTKSITLDVGVEKSFSVNANNAAGRIDISNSDSSVISISSSNAFLDNNSESFKIKGLKEGTARITIKLTDVVTYDEETLTGTYYIDVKVNGEAPATTKTTTTKTTTTKQATTTKRNSSNDSKSSNANLSSLSVKGYSLNKVSDTKYALSVSDNVSSIVIEGRTENGNASISGLGTKSLSNGLNTFNIIVTAEDGNKKTYTIEVTKNAITPISNDNEIILRDGDIITASQLESIKSSRKIVKFIKKNSETDIDYIITIDGNRITDTYDINTKITIKETDNNYDAMSDYRKGNILKFEHDNKFPNGTTISLNVKNYYNDNDSIYVYKNDASTLVKEANVYKVQNGIIDLKLNEGGEYFITKSSDIGAMNTKASDRNSKFYKLIIMVELLIIACTVFVIVMRVKFF